MRKVLRAIRYRVGMRLQQRSAERYLRAQLAEKRTALRLVVGASGTAQAGWISTEHPLVNIADGASLARFFAPASVAAVLAEHVWEHLTPTQAAAAVRNIHELLRPGGRLRIAVPDGLHTDPAYIEYARPGGTGEGSDDHKVFYTFATLTGLLQSAGFEVRLLEWFDEKGSFHFVDWNPEDGMIVRSTRFDDRNRVSPTTYTSLIADGIKC